MKTKFQRYSSIFLLILFFAVVYISCDSCSNSSNKEQKIVDLSSDWKFKTGDNLQWADPNFDDSDWKILQPNIRWEKQGFKTYDGYSWYRKKVFIPSSLKARTSFQDSLLFAVGKIDDTEQTFLNGKLIGQNRNVISADAPFSDNFTDDQKVTCTFRNYILSANDPRILWDKENTIAIRVYDNGGLGGIYDSGQSIRLLDLKDFFKIQTRLFSFKRSEEEVIEKTIVLNNLSNHKKLNGLFRIKIIAFESKNVVFESSEDISIDKNQSKEICYVFNAPQSELHTVYYKFIESRTKTTVAAYEEVPYILTPKPSEKPRINGAKVFGVRPGAPFLYKIPASGLRPMTFSVTDLPEGLNLDENTGIISGFIKQPGKYLLKLIAKNTAGEVSLDFQIFVGDQIALTPPLGWNSWNCWGSSVDDQKVRQAANFMESSGLINHGWTYINIDDGWEAPQRKQNGEIEANEKFPDMKALADYLHNKGLKLGIYSSPGPLTCGRYLGSYEHEYQDAQTYGNWGIDFLKYDLCSYREIIKDNNKDLKTISGLITIQLDGSDAQCTLEDLQKPYRLMGDMLNKVNRDIVYSVCQYGIADVWTWGADVGGNLWRTTGDIIDTWDSMSKIGFSQDVCSDYAAPGNWNDPDMLVVGMVGWGPNLHPTRLTPSEQYTHISLWALLSAPLLIGCDLSRLDDFTLNLLTNDEVLEINQDPLARQAKSIYKNETVEIWAKELEDGSKAVGMFNLSNKEQSVKLNWSDLNIEGKQVVRDLWRQKNLGTFKHKFEARVAVHGVILVNVSGYK